MSGLREVLELWRATEAAGEDYVLATVVQVEGSSYRKPGARMLLTASGRRAGTISGGCLEGEVSRKAWWLTERGPVVKRYSTFYDGDEDVPYGLGCGGTVHVLLERRGTAEPLMELLADCFAKRLPCAVATVIEGPQMGARSWASAHPASCSGTAEWASEAAAALHRRESTWRSIEAEGSTVRLFVEYVPARQGLWVLGAGEDARPVVELAHTLGWHTVVADGRSHLATPERFPLADAVLRLGGTDAAELDPRQTDAVVLMTHSYEQDRALLRKLLPRELVYLGVLGPRRRTMHLLDEIAPELGCTVAECLARLRSPVGLDLRADSPAGIALSIAAEVEAASHAGPRAALHSSADLDAVRRRPIPLRG